jgi:hypothetical protein
MSGRKLAEAWNCAKPNSVGLGLTHADLLVSLKIFDSPVGELGFPLTDSGPTLDTEKGRRMARTERRNSHRYIPAREAICLGWWQGRQFRTVAARLRNLSTTGALIDIETDRPPSKNVWICVAGQAPGKWVQAALLDELVDSPGPAEIRLSFAEPFPYDEFKIAVWGDHGGTRVVPPGAHEQHGSNQQARAEIASKPRPAAKSDLEQIRFFLGIADGQGTEEAGSHGNDSGAQGSPSPPTLVQAYHAEQLLHDRIAPLSWLTIWTISLLLAFSIAAVASTRFEGLRWLGSPSIRGR